MAFLAFPEVGSPSTKTRRFFVWNSKAAAAARPLGEIKWFAQWRRYAFFPTAGTLFDAKCLQEIQDFLNDLMEARRSAR